MGTRFTHFNPLSDENGLGLQERFHERVNNSIKVETDNVYCIFIGDDDKCHKYNINNTKAAELIKDYTPLKLFKYIFGDVFKRYVDNPSYKNMSEEDLLQICADFAEHLKTSGNVLIKDAEDVERERFSAKYPNNAYAKYADPTKVYFSRIIDPDTRKTLYFYFPILLEEDETQYHIILKYNESRQIGIQTFNPFDNDCMMDDMGTFANAILTDLDNSCIMHIRETKISIEFVKDKTEFSYSDNKVDFYRMFFSRMYEYLVSDYRLSETELKQVCDDFESYLNYFKTTEFAETEDINSDKYAFHTLCQNNAFSKRISEATISEATVSEATIRKAKQIYIPKYMYKVRDIKNKKIVKWHYLPLAVVSNDKTYNALISMD